MALTVQQAHDVNTVLSWVISAELAEDAVRPPTHDQARAAAGRLAEDANRRLMAGLDGSQVLERWPAEVPF